jgi:hypothetical protein
MLNLFARFASPGVGRGRRLFSLGEGRFQPRGVCVGLRAKRPIRVCVQVRTERHERTFSFTNRQGADSS